MSFFSNNKSMNRPGPLGRDGLNSCAEKACIRVEKVFDSCLKQLQENDVHVTAFDLAPSNPSYPLTYVSARSAKEECVIENLMVDRFDDRPNFARCSGNVVIPMQVTYTDATGKPGSARCSMTVPFDVVLFVPQPSVVPFRVEASSTVVSPDGEFISNDTLTLDTCITVIIRVVVTAELLVPTFGYCPIPPCQEFTQDECAGFFELPLFPSHNPVCGTRNNNK